jgi:hypothetical protein
MPDFTQNFNRYSYCLNNPLHYTDPDGEWIHIAVGALIGGIMNVATNWKDIDGFWQGMASFGAGAASGALTAGLGPLGAVAGGAITGATNSLISQTGNNFSGINNVNWGQVGLNAGVGGIAGIAGYGAGKWATNNIGNVLINGFNIASPVLKGAIAGGVGGAAGGYAGGFVGGLIMTGDVSVAHKSGVSGFWTGMGTGAGTGAIGGYMAANKAGLSPWTGKAASTVPKNNKITPYAKGREGVDRAAKEITNQGAEILGYEITIEVNGVRVRVDIAANFNGEIILIEVKNGPYARFTPNQSVVYPQMYDNVPLIPYGGNASNVWPGQIGQPTTLYNLLIIRY